MEALMTHVEQKQNDYDQDKDLDLIRQHDGVKQETINSLFTAEQSERICNELYKVTDYLGIVYLAEDSEIDIVLKDIIHVENVP